MILNKENIDYIGIVYGYRWNNVKRLTFNEYVKTFPFGDYEYSYHMYPGRYNWDDDEWCPSSAVGLYCGPVSNIQNILNNKYNGSNIANFKKIYFDPLCKFPRFRLNALTDIKRCLKPDKADSVIISKSSLNYKTYQSTVICSENHWEDVLILYSKSKNKYYFIDYYPDKLPDANEDKIIKNYIAQLADPNTEGLNKWASVLKNSGVIPSDCTTYYTGPVTLLHDNNILQFVDNLINKYMLVTYDTDLDTFIGNSLQKLTDEDLDTINRMLSSTDVSVVGIGLKLLSSYNLRPSACSVGTIIAQNWRNIMSSNVASSVGFKHILESLNLDHNSLYNTNKVINQLYKVSTDDEDKAKARDVVIKQITRQIQDEWNNNYSEVFNNLGLTLKFTIE